MRKYIIVSLFLGVLVINKSLAQNSDSDKHLVDSLLKNDPDLKSLDDDEPSSEGKISMGVGNNLYGNQNRSLAALQNSNSVIFSPAIGYTHKSGFGISLTGDLFNLNNTTQFYQYLVTPSFEYNTGKVIDVSLYYTRYIEKNLYNTPGAPFQNEWYSEFVFKKTWLRPGIAIGYSNGNYHEIVNIDTVVKAGNQRVTIIFTDSVATRITSFSASFTLDHEFNFSGIFTNKDAIDFIPQLSLNSGINTFRFDHKSDAADFAAYTKKELKKIKHIISQTGKQVFELQSAGCNLDLTYNAGIFFIEPNIYFDYYLPKTNDNRLSQIYTISAGITF
jgi:hypothetical protein